VSKAIVPNVLGMTLGAARAVLRTAGFEASVREQQECDASDPACVYDQGVAWAQSPSAGAKFPVGSAVEIIVNP
jgi:beta-lactam-binding protein with PASTA domain